MLKHSKKIAAMQRAVGVFFSKIDPNPDHWTVLAIPASAVGFLLFISGQPLLALAAFAISIGTDAVDGAVARQMGKASKAGAFLDGISDRFAEFFMIAGFFFVPLPSVLLEGAVWALLCIFLGTCMTSFVKAYSEHTGVLSHKSALGMGGILERAERTVLILLSIAAFAYNPLISTAILVLVAVLAAVTVVQRIMGTIS
jgi:phosphatidylglycerophosphate synthase